MKKIIFISVLVLLLSNSMQAQIGRRIPIGNGTSTNQEIETQMLDKAKQFGMGNPAANTPHKVAIANGGFFMSFTNGGNVYYNPVTKLVYAIYGDIFRKYGELGWENGELGYPTSDEKDSDKAGWKRMNTFDKGAIYWNDGNFDIVKSKTAISNGLGGVTTINKIKSPIKHFVISDDSKVSKDIIRVKQDADNKFDNSIVRSTKDKAQKDSNGNDVLCKTEYRKLEVTNLTQDVLSSDAVADLRLGGVYSLSEMKKGNFAMIDNDRKPISIGCTGLGSRKIENPDFTSLWNEQEALLRQKFESKPAIEQFYDCKIVNSESEFKLALGISYKSVAYAAAAKLGYNKTSTKNKYLVTYVAPAYTLQVISGYNFFTNQSENENKDYVVMDKITYGSKLLIYFESELSEKEVSAQLSGSGYGAKLESNIEDKSKFQNIKYNIYLYGSSDAIKIGVSFNELNATVQKMIDDINNQSKVNPISMGKPISYSLRFLNGDIAATTCNANEIPSQICVPNPNVPMDLKINLVNVGTSDYGFYGWNDAEILDENNEIVDTKTFFDFGKSANMGTTNTDINNPFRSVTFKQLSKATRDNGKLKLWFCINNGDQGHYCRILGHNQSNYAKRTGNHYFVEYNLRDLMIPTKIDTHEEPHKETVNAKADSGKKTSMDFNYNFIFTK